MATVMDECIHGITAAFCSLCKEKNGRGDKAKRRAAAGWGEIADSHGMPAGPRTQAKFDGWCKWCGDETTEGSMIFMRGGDWICEDCCVAFDEEGEGE